jgi:hypothetical protein
VGGVVVNLVRPRDLGPDELAAAQEGAIDRAAVAADLKAAGIEADEALVAGLMSEAQDHAVRRVLEDSQRTIVAGLGVPSYELPRLTGGADLGALYEFAALLKDQGLA